MRDYDQALGTLKQQEVQQMRKGMAASSDGLAGQGKYHAECIRYARFYLDQFFNYLTLALQSEAKTAAGSGSVAYASNEEKVKEMWEKLCYSLTKAETSEMLSLVQHIFCTLAAFQGLSKSYFDSFVLRKLDFEKILKSVSERLRTISDDLKNWAGRAACPRSLLKTALQRDDADSFLVKMEVHLLRLFTPEFLHMNVRMQHGEQDN